MTKIRWSDASRIHDRRGQGGGGGGLGDLLKGDVTTGGGDDACSSELEQILCGATNDVSEYWIEQLTLSFGTEYVDTGCGQASSQTGPFYCPADGLVYFDLDFLVTLQNNFGATGDLAVQYIVAHEYGHHVQNVLGIDEEVRRAQQADPQRANQYSVALELQADCFAGAWAGSAEDAGSRRPGELDPRLVGAACAVVPARVRNGRSAELFDVQRSAVGHSPEAEPIVRPRGGDTDVRRGHARSGSGTTRRATWRPARTPPCWRSPCRSRPVR